MTLQIEASRSSVERFRELDLLSSEGKPRLTVAQGFFRRAENQEEDAILEDLFVYWRDLPEFMALRREFIDPKTYSSKWLYVAVKCPKRGNDVYASRVKRRLNWLSNSESVQFFDISDFYDDKAWLKPENMVFSSALWITLTYDTKRGSRLESWENIGIEYNRFISALRRKYGRISVLRTWEATEKGYPHVHAILLFHEAKFSVFPWFVKDEDGKEKLTFRISEKDQVVSYWHSPVVDVQAVSSTKKLFNYMRKYQTKTLLASDSPKGVKTMSLMWLFRKRAFSISGDFRARLHDLITSMHNSNMEIGQTRLDGSCEEASHWIFEGVFTAFELGIRSDRWTVHLNKEQIKTVLAKESRLPRRYGDDLI